MVLVVVEVSEKLVQKEHILSLGSAANEVEKFDLDFYFPLIAFSLARTIIARQQ